MPRYKYDRDGIQFVLDNYQELSAGIWPDPGEQSEGKRPGVSSHGPFESSCLVSAEVAARVKLCGLDGLLVECRYAMSGDPHQVPATEAEIEKYYHIPLYEVERRINRVTWYCVGSRRAYHKDSEGKYRYMDYEEWKRESRNRQTIRNLKLIDARCVKTLDKPCLRVV